MINEINVFMGGFDDGRTQSVQQYDVNSRKYLWRLWKRPGEAYQMAEDAVVGVVFDWRGAEPSHEYETEVIDRSTVLVTVPAAAMRRAGPVDMQLLIHQKGGLLNSPVINFMALRSLKPADKETDEPALMLVALVDDVKNALTAAEAATESIENMQVQAVEAETPSAKLETVGGVKVLTLGLVRGEPGGSNITDEQVAAAVEAYLKENPIEGGAGIESIKTEETTDGTNRIKVVIKLTDGTGTVFYIQNGHNGKDGEDGVGIIDITGQDAGDGTNRTRVTVKYTNGLVKDFYVPNGVDGVGIESVEQIETSTEDYGENRIRMRLTDGSGAVFVVRNGRKGNQGIPGVPGAPGGYFTPSVDADGNLTWIPSQEDMPTILGQNIKGPAGTDGADGTGISSAKQTTVSTADYGENIFTVKLTDGTVSTFTVRNGRKGSQGLQGEKGDPGYTPVKGVDYWTAADIAEILQKLDGAGSTVPDYWLSELETKADAIQEAMEKAGRNKSAFLWYTDAHWVAGNSKVSPMLLNYLYMHTPMNKVNFGGDIIGDTLLATRDEMKYLYEWRKAIKDLPNHHSVLGNHDMFELDSVDYEDNNYRYAFMIAPEETPDMVMGNGNYYYIDNRCEKTRYLYIAFTTDGTEMFTQGQFIVDAIKSVDEGWHIVAISHRWWQYSSSSTPTVGGIGMFEGEILSVFDAYNARKTRAGSNCFYEQDFTDAKGKVEFCIGGHIHVDHDIESDGGIPVIITTADANQNRVPDSAVDSGTVGTITESAVFGIIADYNDAENTKITVVGVGRGTSRVVRTSGVKVVSISDITYSGDTTVGTAIDKAKFKFTVNYSNGKTDTVSGATSVSPATIDVVGNNTVTITYTEGAVTVSGTVTIVGQAVEAVNLFDKNDPDVLDTGRFNSSNNAVASSPGQLCTGFIEGKVGDTFTVKTDRSLKTSVYTCDMMCYDANKSAIDNINAAMTAWTISDDEMTGILTIPSNYQFNPDNIVSYEGTTYVRFCVAYTDMDNIVITKS